MQQYVKRIKPCQPKIRKWVDGLLNAFLPWRCVVCSLESEDSGICRHCKAALPWNSRACNGCGLPLPGDDDLRCGACLARPPVIDSVVSPLLFKFPVNHLIHKFKFHGDVAAGRVLAELLIGQISNGETVEMPDLLVPVPMHRWRMLKRGMNPAFELAHHLQKTLKIPLAVHDLRRTRHTPAQSGLDAVHRKKNLKGAFCWSGKKLDGLKIVLVDDVITTGTTISECSRVLIRAGAENVSAWALARAVR